MRLCDAEGDELLEIGTSNADTQETTYNSFVTIPEMTVAEDSTVELEDFVMNFTNGWSIVACPFDLSTVTKITYTKDDGTTHEIVPNLVGINYYINTSGYATIIESTQNLTNYTEANGYTLMESHDSVAIDDFFSGPEGDNKIIIVKDYGGNAYLPEWNFNGLGAWHNLEGMQIKTTASFNLTITAKRKHRIVGGIIEYGSTMVFPKGWTIFNPGLKHPKNMEVIAETFVQDLIIIKNYLGHAYLPEWNFNGVGDTIPGEGYQVKMDNWHTVDHIEDE